MLHNYIGDLFVAGRGETDEPMIKGFFSRKPQTDLGIVLPPDLAIAISSFDVEDNFLPMHKGTGNAFRFRLKDEEKYFRNKRLALHTLALTFNKTLVAYINRQGGTHSIPL